LGAFFREAIRSACSKSASVLTFLIPRRQNQSWLVQVLSATGLRIAHQKLFKNQVVYCGDFFVIFETA
jgi:hypothetical protein